MRQLSPNVLLGAQVWEREMELRSLLRHPNILPFYGVILQLKQPAQIVTDLCEGSVRELVSHLGAIGVALS
jgi:serine/threonine protein kinase